MKGKQIMKNQNLVFIAIALAFALAPVTQAAPNPGGIATRELASEQPSIIPPPLPVVTIHSTGDVLRGKTGSFVLHHNGLPVPYVNFKVSGTAIPGVDYVALVSPAYIGPSGYGVISVKTLLDPRASSNNQAYSVVVTLEPGAGYSV